MIEFRSVSKCFKDKQVLSGISLTIEDGQMVSIIGESGCGKTTLLKMINRLIEPTGGEIYINGTNHKEIDKIKLRRNMGYVIQQTGLFPHMTVRDNIQVIPKIQKTPPDILEDKTVNIMRTVGLEPALLDRFPAELSGGQQQRVGVARAFIIDPDIILMDEPFSALDPMTKSNLQDELVTLQSKYSKTVVFVTHDMDEAIKISDKICIMKNGEVVQYDTPENILKSPANDFVQEFVGKKRLWSAPEYIKASDIMIENPVTCSQYLSIFKCVERMRSTKVDNLMVVDNNNKLVGIIRAKSIMHLQNKMDVVGSKMLRSFSATSPEENIVNILKTVDDKDISCIPVVADDNSLLGVITKGSLLTTLSKQFIEEE